MFNPHPVYPHPTGKTHDYVDDYLLQLILIDTVALRDPRRGPVAERIIEQAIPARQYDLVMARYDELTDDSDDETYLLERCFRLAAGRNGHWKGALLAQLRCVIAADGEIDAAGMNELTDLAEAIDATKGLRTLLKLPLY
ncbi:MAG: hypothetical protein BWY52_00349 [Chloroflexi bacterium ADurb.Bin325]|nr:MAG: hypothetical protein BWY52_00349 [Chloroflexi bacterium ADurb.Bin325]